jgi:hypothetical protein
VEVAVGQNETDGSDLIQKQKECNMNLGELFSSADDEQ